jgi:hypothetical protein
MNFKSLQEAADYVVTKIVEQGGQSKKPNSEECMYFGPDDRRCAIGWLLDDDIDPQIKNYWGGLSSLLQDYDLQSLEFLREETDFFATLQEFHDACIQKHRVYFAERLHDDYGIDTVTNLNWNKWIKMGKPSDG